MALKDQFVSFKVTKKKTFGGLPSIFLFVRDRTDKFRKKLLKMHKQEQK